jgi:hypothetical protein
MASFIRYNIFKYLVHLFHGTNTFYSIFFFYLFFFKKKKTKNMYFILLGVQAQAGLSLIGSKLFNTELSLHLEEMTCACNLIYWCIHCMQYSILCIRYSILDTYYVLYSICKLDNEHRHTALDTAYSFT